MNALQPKKPPLQSVHSSRPIPRHRGNRQPQHHPHREIVIETAAKLVANVVLSIASVSALIQLWPHYQGMQEKVREIGAEVQATEQRVHQSRDNFSRYFDAKQTQGVMQENSTRVDPHQRQIILLEKDRLSN